MHTGMLRGGVRRRSGGGAAELVQAVAGEDFGRRYGHDLAVPPFGHRPPHAGVFEQGVAGGEIVCPLGSRPSGDDGSQARA
ncbi:hypothetical protein DP116_13290 [Brasilonema bromeliae SPC951]|uniref:Uncharacterized protein n=1 Tax=Brasilonema bromeliae SPC951 TaxID=385972 RepID=A0ABX1P7I5_9CYAN|nr:hypothetical protein [Brasilonema bromeliae SPC951]